MERKETITVTIDARVLAESRERANSHNEELSHYVELALRLFNNDGRSSEILAKIASLINV